MPYLKFDLVQLNLNILAQPTLSTKVAAAYLNKKKKKKKSAVEPGKATGGRKKLNASGNGDDEGENMIVDESGSSDPVQQLNIFLYLFFLLSFFIFVNYD